MFLFLLLCLVSSPNHPVRFSPSAAVNGDENRMGWFGGGRKTTEKRNQKIIKKGNKIILFLFFFNLIFCFPFFLFLGRLSFPFFLFVLAMSGALDVSIKREEKKAAEDRRRQKTTNRGNKFSRLVSVFSCLLPFSSLAMLPFRYQKTPRDERKQSQGG